MEQYLTEHKVYKAIKSVFSHFGDCAHENLAKYWKKLGQQEQYKAGRAQVYLKNLARNPQKYFSRAETGRAWAARIRAYQQHGGFKSENRDAVAFIVGSPKMEVDRNVRSAFVNNPELSGLFSKFTGLVLDWEYSRTLKKKEDREKAQNAAKEILKMETEIENLKNNNVGRYAVWEFIKNIKRTSWF